MKTASEKDNHGQPVQPLQIVPPVRRWYQNGILRAFREGLVLALPFIIILAVMYFLIKLMLMILAPISAVLYPGMDYIPWYVSLMSLIILVGFFLGLGLIVKNREWRETLHQFETDVFSQIPLYKTIRETVQQFAGLKEMPFSQVVLIDPFGTGIMLTGFITERISSEMFTVFVPTAPNPTNGNIYHVPRSKLVFLNIRSDAALRTIVGMGTGSSYLFSKDKISEVTEIVKDPTSYEVALDHPVN